MHNASEHALAVLVDIENMARPGARNRGEFDIHLVMNRLAEKGRVVVKRAYADWSRYRDARRELMNAGLELIEMPSAREGAKNRADIKMAVDAMEIAYSRQHVDIFVIVSGDSDFTPLIGKLRELNKRVIGVGRDESSSSPLLIANCDEFFFYDSLAGSAISHHSGGVRPEALNLLRETLMARQREGDERPQASAVKDSMRRRDPAFDENEIGFSTFSKFLEDAQSKGVIVLVKDARSGTYHVDLTEGGSDLPSSGTARPVEIGEGRRRRRRRGGQGGGGDSASREGRPEAEATAAETTVDSDAEVFEFEVPTRRVTADLPPLDQPITYEDVVMAGDDIEEATGEDPDADATPTRGARRRRRPLATTPEPGTSDLEEPTAEANEATPAADNGETAAPTSRRRVRRGTAIPATDADAEAPADTPTDDEAQEKPKRRTRAKKVETEADAPSEAETPAAEEEKPKRRTRTKKVETEDTVAAPADEPATDEEAPKPRRRPRTTKKAEDTPTAEAAVSDDEAPKPRRRPRTTKKADDETPTAGISPKESPY